MSWDTIDLIIANIYYTVKGFKDMGLELTDLIDDPINLLTIEASDELSDEEILRIREFEWYEEARKLVSSGNFGGAVKYISRRVNEDG